MAAIKKIISKSQYLKGIRCPKALWLYKNRSDLSPEVSESKKNVFNTGHEVGELAKKCFKAGFDITDEYYEIDQAIKSTETAIDNGYKVIFEATACASDKAYSRIDILKKIRGSKSWDLLEVKASTKVKSEHIHDSAFQRYAFEGSGYQIRKSILMHLNKEYVRIGDLNPIKMFILQDITREVFDLSRELPQKLDMCKSTLRRRSEPSIEIGTQCFSPFDCDYIDYCWDHIPEYSVYDVFKGKKLDALLSEGIIHPEDVPDDFKMTERQRIDIESCKSGKVFINIERLRGFLESIKFPIYYLDYETIFPAVPMFNYSSLYLQIPFQFSLHIQRKKNGNIRHVEYLHTDTYDPRPNFVRALIDSCKKRGSIVVYNQSFEESVNNSLATSFPEFSNQLKAINERMVDLLIPFRSRMIYHPNMNGSASIKYVLPAFVRDMSYSNLEIQNGGDASLSYYKCIKGLVNDIEREDIFQNLKEYCGLDTFAEVKLISVLNSKVLN